MGLVKGVHHVSMKCRNDREYAEEIHFYKEILGIPVIRVWDDGIMFSTGMGIVEVFRSGGTTPGTHSINHFAFEVEDVDECIRVIRGAGYEISMEPQYFTIPSNPKLPARIAFCKGPLGEEIEFFKDCTEEMEEQKKNRGLNSMEECLMNEVLEAYFQQK